jgi:hypothetical protein
MLINGQVENIVGIIDIGYVNPLELLKPMKTIISFLQGNYKYKLHATYIIKSTGLFQIGYGIAKTLMKEDTIRKIHVLQDEKKITPLLEYCNLSQL